MSDQGTPGVGEAGEPGSPVGLTAIAPAGSERNEPPPVSPTVGPPPLIRPSDRVCAIGQTGSGKSEAINHLWSIYPGQRVLIDVNDEYRLGEAALANGAGGAIVAERVGDIDWRARTIHFVPRSLSERLWDDLYAALFERRNLCVALHESYGPTGPNRVPTSLGLVLRQGRKRNILHLAASQEPMNIAPVLYSQAQHVFLFTITRPDELRQLAPRFRLRPDELAAELAHLQDRFGEHAYLRASERDRVVRRMPPLPLEVLEHTRRHVLATV